MSRFQGTNLPTDVPTRKMGLDLLSKINEIADDLGIFGANYTKWPSGTLEQWGTITGNPGAWSAGTLYQKTVTITYPIPFVGFTPVPTGSIQEDTDTTQSFLGKVSSVSLTGFIQYVYNQANTYTGTLTYRWTAKGRWK